MQQAGGAGGEANADRPGHKSYTDCSFWSSPLAAKGVTVVLAVGRAEVSLVAVTGCASRVRFIPPIIPATRLYDQEQSPTTIAPSTAERIVITIQEIIAIKPVTLATSLISDDISSPPPIMPTKLAIIGISAAYNEPVKKPNTPDITKVILTVAHVSIRLSSYFIIGFTGMDLN